MFRGLANIDFSGIGSLGDDSAYIDFWHASWCGPCKAFESTNPQGLTSIPIRSRDFDNDGPASAGVDAIPTIILYVGGSEVARATPADTATIRSWDSKYGRGAAKSSVTIVAAPKETPSWAKSEPQAVVVPLDAFGNEITPSSNKSIWTSINSLTSKITGSVSPKPAPAPSTAPAITATATRPTPSSTPVSVSTPQQAAAVVNQISPSAPPQIKATAIASVLAAAKRGVPIYVPKKKSSSLPWILGIGAVAVLGVGLLAVKMMDD